MLLSAITLTNLVCCEVSCANLAMAGKIRSATALVPDRIRSGPIRSTMSARWWAVHLLTAACRWLQKKHSCLVKTHHGAHSSPPALYQTRHASSLESATASTLLVGKHLFWLNREHLVEHRQIISFKRRIHLIKLHLIHLKSQTMRTQMKKRKITFI